MKLFNIIMVSLILSIALCSCSNTKNGQTPKASNRVESTAPSNSEATAGKPENSPANKQENTTASATQAPNNSTESKDNDYSSVGFDLMNNDSVGSLKYNLSSDDVVKALGEPEEKTKFQVWGSDGKEHQTWIYGAKGILLDVVKTENTAAIYSIDISNPCTFKTTRQIGIGSKRADVLNAYKNEINPAENKEGSALIVAGSIYGGIVFTFENDSVSEIFIGASAE
ncbi:hypothetical protein [Acetivibrio cellulolyticus]|uniref:hypothetical protein n=1 Tax=Acetivibrio cellulolyticus TaxID=35830 RepID=UPI0001E2C308|nr:hypothetical protein [Acetivibrio cellulolyticus]